MASPGTYHPPSETLGSESHGPAKGGPWGDIKLPIPWSNLESLGKELGKGYSADQTQDLFFIYSKVSDKIKLNLSVIHG